MVRVALWFYGLRTTAYGLRTTAGSHPGIPLPTKIGGNAAAALSDAGHGIDELHAIDELGVLVADVQLGAQAQGRAVPDGKILAVHAIRQDCLRVVGVEQVEAFVV